MRKTPILPRKALFPVLLILAAILLSGCGRVLPAGADSPYITADGYSGADILSYFSDIAFGSEYGGYRGTVCKWTTPVKLGLVGNWTEADRALLEELMETLRSLEGFPGISFAEGEEANLLLRFVPQGELTDYFGENAENARGMSLFFFRLSTGEILKAEAGVASDITLQSARDSVISEELLQCLGLASDTYTYPESIFYEGYTAASRPSPLDWALVRLLYHPKITPGMAHSEALRVAAPLLGITDTMTENEETMYG